MERGKFRIDKYFLSTLKHHLDEGWHLSGRTHKDSDGYFWFSMERNRQ